MDERESDQVRDDVDVEDERLRGIVEIQSLPRM